MSELLEKQGYADVISEIANEVLDFVSVENVDIYEECWEKIENTVKSLLDFDKPKVMVYGIYNSGKSTLINALMKEEVAVMADRPMTERIDEYDQGQYVLVDSPGIDAPIKHEMVTNEFLDKCHIILFVISSKGGFEGKYNYQKMAELIKRDIPFLIVLNERGYAINPESTQQEKKLKKAEYAQELKEIQYKIIENLIKVTGDKNIDRRYEVYVLNAKKALTGIQKNKLKLYESSNIEFLNQRIIQLVKNGSAMKVLKQPITNLKNCLDDIESHIAKQMQEGSTGNFATKIEILRRKQENLKDEMRILIRQTTDSHIGEIASYYISNNAESIEGEEYTIFRDIEDKYMLKLTDILSYIERNFKDIDGVDSMIDLESNLMFEAKEKHYSNINSDIENNYDEIEPIQEEEKKGFWDFLKSQKKREEEKRERLEREVDFINEKNQNRLNEQIRLRQEARQSASRDMIKLQETLISIVNSGIVKKFENIINYIKGIECENKKLCEEGSEKLRKLAEIRAKIANIENKLTY